MAAAQATPGALAASYDLPRVRYRHSGMALLSVLAVLFFAARLYWRILAASPASRPLAGVWVLTVAAVAFQLIVSLRDKPAKVTSRQARQLDELLVVAVIPVFNEDPAILDRSLWSLANSSRPPDFIHVVEDGPTQDYWALRSHWTRFPFIGWDQPPWGGKRIAHAFGFRAHPEADVFITIDSDTAVEHCAIDEALKPLADPKVMSVAFIEEIINKRANLLTWVSQAASLVFQFTAWGAQSALGDLIVNRGTCALYRASVIREIIPAYEHETFLGHQIKLGDDSALTLFSRARGRTVQQVTAFSLPVYPETLKHHVKQRLRWARGSSLRHIWRLRYLSPLTYSWWFVVSYVFLTFLSVGLVVTIAFTWPQSEHTAVAVLGALALSGFATAFRVLCVQRSDDPWWVPAVQLLACPVTVLWRLAVLRFVRYYGIATCLKQGWVTRQQGTEVGISGAEAPVPEPVLATESVSA
jgi:hyaluronan synthase